MIIVKNKKCSEEKIRKEFPDVIIVDVTSHAKDDMIRLSPFYPHGGIPVPFSPGWTAMSVESIWQGLKVFETAGVDTALFRNNTMKDLKRTVRKYGKPKGHRKGIGGSELLEYIQARKLIYVPTYKWMMEHKARAQVEKLRELAKTRTVVLLDYDTNPDVEDWHSPLSHASLIKAYLDGNYPVYEGSEVDNTPKQEEVHYDFSVGQKVKHPKFGEGVVSENVKMTDISKNAAIFLSFTLVEEEEYCCYLEILIKDGAMYYIGENYRDFEWPSDDLYDVADLECYCESIEDEYCDVESMAEQLVKDFVEARYRYGGYEQDSGAQAIDDEYTVTIFVSDNKVYEQTLCVPVEPGNGWTCVDW